MCAQVCGHCGYGGSLAALVAANADYVVDAVCGQLRDLRAHPRAPHLLATLLRRSRVAPQLLPLMAEPLRRALQVRAAASQHPVRLHCRIAPCSWQARVYVCAL